MPYNEQLLSSAVEAYLHSGWAQLTTAEQDLLLAFVESIEMDAMLATQPEQPDDDVRWGSEDAEN
jgi:hypothetical protein